MFLYSAKPKRIMSCIIMALLIFTGSISYSPVFANENNIVQYSDSITGGSIYFDVSTGAITDCDTTVTAVIIPDQINGIEVISISSAAFESCSKIETLKLPNTLQSIGARAFTDCKAIKEIIIPEGVESIESQIFHYCSALETVTIPSTVTTIYETAFRECTSLKSIDVSEQNDEYTSKDGVLFYKDMSRICKYPAAKEAIEYTIPQTVKYTKKEAFMGAKYLQKLYFPEGFISISENAVRDCKSLKIVELPESLNTIGNYAFYGCTSLEKINILSTDITILNTAFENSPNVVIYGKSGSYVETFAKENNIEFLDSTVNPIVYYQVTGGKLTFDKSTGTIIDCDDSVTKVFIPEKISDVPVKSINADAFVNCNSLESFEVEESNYYYSSIDGVLFNESMNTICKYPPAREGSEYSVPSEVKWSLNNVFMDAKYLERVAFQDGFTTLAYSAFRDCKLLKSVELPDSLDRIDGYAFYGCSALTEIDIPEKVTTYFAYSFGGCTSLEEFNISSGVIDIYNTAFVGCTSIKEFTVHPDNTKYCSENGVIFDKSKALLSFYPAGASSKSYNIPETVLTIYSNAFNGAQNLEEIIIPGNVERLWENAFANCQKLKSVTIDHEMQSIDATAFTNSQNVVIYGKVGSYAETYAKDNGIPFKSAEQYDEPNTDVPSTTPETPTTDEPEITPQPEQPTITPSPEEPEETPEIIQQNQIIKCSNINTTFYVKGTRKLNASANTKLTYKSSNKKIATVSYTGKVTMINPGKVTITITAAETSEYKGAVKKVTFKSTLKKPALTATALKGKKNKLTWSKVPGATGYKLYIYDKSKKKYICRLTKKASVKSVTHKGLKAGKVYKYKIRAYRIVSGKKVYSPYSAVKTIKARK